RGVLGWGLACRCISGWRPCRRRRSGHFPCCHFAYASSRRKVACTYEGHCCRRRPLVQGLPPSGLFHPCFISDEKWRRFGEGGVRVGKRSLSVKKPRYGGVFGVARGESVAPRVGLEPTTNGLTVHCSAN